MQNEIPDNLTEEDAKALYEEHEAHNTCLRFTENLDLHLYCEDCCEALYFVNFNSENESGA